MSTDSRDGREKWISFIRGPRDGEEIRWTQPQSPIDRMDYHHEDKIYIYRQLARYADDNEIIYYYAFLSEIPNDSPNNPYYDRAS